MNSIETIPFFGGVAGAITVFVIAIIFSSFVEYWIHRLAHEGIVLKEVHWSHHQINRTGGWLWDYLYVIRIGLWPFAWIGFPFGVRVGFIFLLGEIVYLGLAVYSHELQHRYPNQVFWMKCPVHYLHHRYRKGSDNFGLLTDFWDRVFRTSSDQFWKPSGEKISLRKLLGIKWY
ncbi:MAG TPA: sterol desaturase family protein [Gemmataceae bacterium]|nr:sterol desaturase family protein [Gemmataceae bacterium]